jgi:uncharacterized membrane protein
MNSKKSVRNQDIFNIVFCALLIALIALLSMPPLYIGFLFAIPFLGVQMTIIHIPVIFGGVILGRKYSWLLGLAFGLGSLWAAFMTGAFIFQNPLVSVLPRFLFGIAIYEIYNLLRKVIKNKAILFSVTAVLSTLSHTLLVALAAYFFGGYMYENMTKFVQDFLVPIISLNGVMETVLSVLVGLPVFLALVKFTEEGKPAAD